MYELGDRAANLIVAHLSEESKALRRAARHRDNAGPENAHYRKAMRLLAHDLECAIAGLNTGEGVARASARKEHHA